MSADVTAAVERTRARVSWAGADAEGSALYDGQVLLAEVERLRAERETTRIIVPTMLWAKASELYDLLAEHHATAKVFALESTTTYGWIVRDDEPTRERLRALIERQAAALADGSITAGVLATLVLNALTSEDGRG